MYNLSVFARVREAFEKQLYGSFMKHKHILVMWLNQVFFCIIVFPTSGICYFQHLDIDS